MMRRDFRDGRVRRAMRSGSGVWTPTSVSGCKLWLSAGKLVGLADTDPVSTYTDFSGNGYDATGSSTTRPLYRTTGPVVDWDGSDDYLLLHTSLALPASWTIGLRFKMDATPAAASFFSPITIPCVAGSTWLEIIVSNLGGAYANLTWSSKIAGGANAVGCTFSLDTNQHYLIVTYNNGTTTDVASYTARLDGAAATVAASGGMARIASTVGSLGARRDTATTFPFNGRVDKAVVYDSVLVGSALTGLETYLSGASG